MALRWAAVCGAVLALLAGCGDGETGTADGPAALGYAPRDAFAVAIVPTDLDGEQLRRFEVLVRPSLDGGSLRTTLGEGMPEGVDFERDVEPLLGSELVISASGALDDPQVVAALETPDGAQTRALLEKARIPADEDVATVDGDTLVFAINGGRGTLDAAIERRRAGQGLDGVPAGGDDDALLRLFGDPRPLVRATLPGADEPWIAALRSFDASLRLEEGAIAGRATLGTDPKGLTDDDLPLATGDDAPQAGDVDGAIAAANRDQSRTTVFLARLARRAFPDSRFVREVERLEADLGVSFEDEVLAQFDGPSASVATPDGAFAAVSDVADPERMRELLPRLAPRLPPVLRGLQGLGNRGMLALLLFAPDAPLTPGALLSAAVEVRPLSGGADERLFEITGLDEPGPRGEPPFAGPGTVVFGMIGDRFVVATDLQRARAVAAMGVSEVEGAEGAAVARTDLSTWPRESLERALGLDATVPLGEATGELEASTEALEARLRVELPNGLD